MARTRTIIETFNMQPYQKALDAGFSSLAAKNVIPRIWRKDWTVWKNQPDEIANRLGWLFCPKNAERDLPKIRKFVGQAKRQGCSHVLLLGMGGSSLAPLVMANVFATPRFGLELKVLDSTDPAAVLGIRKKLNPAKTLYIVSSKSGTTTETMSFFKFFWNEACESLGKKRATGHFAVVTDPDSPLADLARGLGFARCLADPEIGGRFSALSVFNLLPAALKGIRIRSILRSGKDMAASCRNSSDLRANPGAHLGTILAALASQGRDKVTFLLPPRLGTFGLWLEQLIAESTGKEGRGILPVAGEKIGPPRVYGSDRLFIQIKAPGSRAEDRATERLKKAGFPLISLRLPSLSRLGGQFFLWEFATAVAGFFLMINPFNQPDVESAKRKTQDVLTVFRREGVIPEENPQFQQGGIAVFSDIRAASLDAWCRLFLGQARPGDYIVLQVFLAPDRQKDTALARLRTKLRAETGLATTLGYGPRYLHSTGQLHKGDRGNGLFIQITAGDERDLPIPDEPGSSSAAISFGVLKAAQARGDMEALKSAGRRIAHLHLKRPTPGGLRKIAALFG
jgi:glucose-6-phosphate isomerase